MLLRLVPFLYAMAQPRAQPLPSSCDFNISLLGVKCIGLSLYSASTLAECAAAACAAGAQMYEFCVSGATCGTYAGPSCWAGTVGLPCAPSTEGWVGASAPNAPPPPPPPPQVFLPPSLTPPLATLDLADGAPGAWALSIDGGAPRAVAVPGGGYSSDEQPPPWLQQAHTLAHANYSRAFALPSGWPAGAALRLSLGAVNHWGVVALDGRVVGSHGGPLMPFDVALPPLAPGSAHSLAVLALPYRALAGLVPSGFLYDEAWTRPPSGFSSRACAGICKRVALIALPPLHIESITTAAAVGPPATLAVRLVVRNEGPGAVAAGALEVALALGAGTRGAAWPYPALAPLPLPALGAGAAVELALAVDWSPLGPASWWWPNRPFNESYAPQLHTLTATVRGAGGGGGLCTATRRFGFVEHAEGPFFWTLNGHRFNQLSDATPENAMSFYDAYAGPAFAPGPGGALETWRRFMRLGLTSNRVHQSTPTRAMLDAADEAGFLLKPESPVRGLCNYAACPGGAPPGPLFEQSVGELVAACRGHPSVAAFSVENESGEDPALLARLIDAAAAAHPGAPLTTEGSGAEWAFNGTAAHAVNLLHYAVPDGTRAHIRAVGECAWCVADGLEEFAGLALAGRLNDVAYYAGWDVRVRSSARRAIFWALPRAHPVSSRPPLCAAADAQLLVQLSSWYEREPARVDAAAVPGARPGGWR